MRDSQCAGKENLSRARETLGHGVKKGDREQGSAMLGQGQVIDSNIPLRGGAWLLRGDSLFLI